MSIFSNILNKFMGNNDDNYHNKTPIEVQMLMFQKVYIIFISLY